MADTLNAAKLRSLLTDQFMRQLHVLETTSATCDILFLFSKVKRGGQVSRG